MHGGIAIIEDDKVGVQREIWQIKITDHHNERNKCNGNTGLHI